MIISLNSIGQLIFVMETGCVFLAVGKKSLNIIWMKFAFKALVNHELERL
jgi:hypothetical protein